MVNCIIYTLILLTNFLLSRHMQMMISIGDINFKTTLYILYSVLLRYN